MKSKLQQVMAEVTDEQAMRIWELVSNYVEDQEVAEEEVSAGLVELRGKMDAAVASYAE